MSDLRFTSIKFTNFKALHNYSISLSELNVMVGPNNSGKSTIVSSLRILDVALKKANRLRAEIVPLPNGGQGNGHRIPEAQISVALENVSTDYNGLDSKIEFRLSNRNKLFLFFPVEGGMHSLLGNYWS